MGRGAVQTSTPVGPQVKFSDGVPEMSQNASVKWSVRSSPAGETGGALDGRVLFLSKKSFRSLPALDISYAL